MVKYDISKLKFGSKIKFKGRMYFVTNIGKRVIKAQKIINVDPENNPHGSLGILISIPVKDIEK